jgi:hypothetical protein
MGNFSGTFPNYGQMVVGVPPGHPTAGDPGLSLVEAQSHFSLWCMFSSLLLATNDVRKRDPEIERILLNNETLAISQVSQSAVGTASLRAVLAMPSVLSGRCGHATPDSPRSASDCPGPMVRPGSARGGRPVCRPDMGAGPLQRRPGCARAQPGQRERLLQDRLRTNLRRRRRRPSHERHRARPPEPLHPPGLRPHELHAGAARDDVRAAHPLRRLDGLHSHGAAALLSRPAPAPPAATTAANPASAARVPGWVRGPPLRLLGQPRSEDAPRPQQERPRVRRPLCQHAGMQGVRGVRPWVPDGAHRAGRLSLLHLLTRPGPSFPP